MPWHLVRANLWTHPIRTLLTAGSVAIAVFLLCFLKTVLVSLEAAIDAYLNSVADGTSFLAELQRQNPDDLVMWVIAGATEATAYGFYFSTVRIQQAPSPVGGNNAPTLLNATWTATDVRVTRL